MPALYNKKGTLPPFIVTQLLNARDCPFIKIWLNGSIRTTFTESYKIIQRLPHRPIRPPIFVYYSWAASYIRQPNYVGFSKTGSDTTIEPIFDERTASDQTWKNFQSFRRHVFLTMKISKKNISEYPQILRIIVEIIVHRL